MADFLLAPQSQNYAGPSDQLLGLFEKFRLTIGEKRCRHLFVLKSVMDAKDRTGLPACTFAPIT
jgi:hypothetical protein